MANQQNNKKRPLYKSFGESYNQNASSSKKMKKQLEEEDVYIVEYLTKDIEGFAGTIKHRYADFQVNEIDLEGNVVRLTSYEPPVYPSQMAKPEIDESKVNGLIFVDDIAKIKSLVDLKDSIESVEIEVTNFSKEQRTFLHKYVQLVSNNKLNSNTVDRNGKKYIEVNNKKKLRQEIQRSNSQRIKFLHFTAMKTNTDTSEMLFLLGKQLSKKISKFTIAGTKDKRGVTTQRVSCKYLNYADVRHLDLYRIKMGNFAYKDTPLNLGDLKGNFFRIAIRNVTATDESIEKTMRLFKENGFINYFGLQRFGNNPSAATHDVGRLLIQDDWRGAVHMILRPGPNMGTSIKIQKVEFLKHRYQETKSAKLTLRGVDDIGFLKSSIEARILQGLATHGENAYLNALENITRNTATLYLHAYQSFVWNREEVKPEIKQEIKSEEDADDEDEEEPEEVLYDVPSSKANIHVVTEDDIKQGLYKISDVVYPSPGYDVKLPENEIGSWYYDYLKEDGLTLDSFKKNVKIFSLSGSYRRITLKCDNVQWSIMRYDTPDDDLLLSDACVLAGKTLKTFTKKTLKAVILEMSLPPSVYATMALREILRCSTNQQYQIGLSEKSKPTPLPPIVTVVKTPEGSYIDY
ncbi:hypothetical protein M8J75_000392 [Diaphorina citri]|nr:hypothetical protein M8J75_000392 [Diaphorina citri]